MPLTNARTRTGTRIARISVATLLVGAAVSTAAPRLASASTPAGFSTKEVVGHLGRGVGGIPTAFAYAPGGRVFIARKTGVVDVWDHGKQHVFIDLSGEVNSAQGRGLLGLALDPKFATTGRVFLMFTTNHSPAPLDARGGAGGEIISIKGKPGDPDTASPSTRVTLLTGYDSSAAQHADGALRFDHAGNLYASWGDATADAVAKTALEAQNLDDLRGKIVRINPTTGKGVPGNPWYDAKHPSSVRSKVYVYGVRNAYRFTVDQQNGTLYVGDVGWSSWDELDSFSPKTAGATQARNGGWPCYEGAEGHSQVQALYSTSPKTKAACKAVYPPGTLGGTGVGAHAPLYSYPHGNGACIIGGPKYTGGSNYPAKYNGKVFIADWSRDTFQTVDPISGAASKFGKAGSWGQALDIQIAPDGNVAYLAEGTNSLREITYKR